MLDVHLTEAAALDILGDERQLCAAGAIMAGHPAVQAAREIESIAEDRQLSAIAQCGISWEAAMHRRIERLAKRAGFPEDRAVFAAEVFSETITNSIEYGAEFCERGDVLFQIHISRHGIFCVITDPGNGFDITLVTESTGERRLLPPSVHGTPERGHGGEVLALPGVRVNAERTQEAFRMLFLVEDVEKGS